MTYTLQGGISDGSEGNGTQPLDVAQQNALYGLSANGTPLPTDALTQLLSGGVSTSPTIGPSGTPTTLQGQTSQTQSGTPGTQTQNIQVALPQQTAAPANITYPATNTLQFNAQDPGIPAALSAPAGAAIGTGLPAPTLLASAPALPYSAPPSFGSSATGTETAVANPNEAAEGAPGGEGSTAGPSIAMDSPAGRAMAASMTNGSNYDPGNYTQSPTQPPTASPTPTTPGATAPLTTPIPGAAQMGIKASDLPQISPMEQGGPIKRTPLSGHIQVNEPEDIDAWSKAHSDNMKDLIQQLAENDKKMHRIGIEPHQQLMERQRNLLKQRAEKLTDPKHPFGGILAMAHIMQGEIHANQDVDLFRNAMEDKLQEKSNDGVRKAAAAAEHAADIASQRAEVAHQDATIYKTPLAQQISDQAAKASAAADANRDKLKAKEDALQLPDRLDRYIEGEIYKNSAAPQSNEGQRRYEELEKEDARIRAAIQAQRNAHQSDVEARRNAWKAAHSETTAQQEASDKAWRSHPNNQQKYDAIKNLMENGQMNPSQARLDYLTGPDGYDANKVEADHFKLINEKLAALGKIQLMDQRHNKDVRAQALEKGQLDNLNLRNKAAEAAEKLRQMRIKGAPKADIALAEKQADAHNRALDIHNHLEYLHSDVAQRSAEGQLRALIQTKAVVSDIGTGPDWGDKQAMDSMEADLKQQILKAKTLKGMYAGGAPVPAPKAAPALKAAAAPKAATAPAAKNAGNVPQGALEYYQAHKNEKVTLDGKQITQREAFSRHFKVDPEALTGG